MLPSTICIQPLLASIFLYRIKTCFPFIRKKRYMSSTGKSAFIVIRPLVA